MKLLGLYRTVYGGIGYRRGTLDTKSTAKRGLGLLAFEGAHGKLERVGRTKASRGYHSLTVWNVPVTPTAEADLAALKAKDDLLAAKLAALREEIEAVRGERSDLAEAAEKLLRPVTREDFEGEEAAAS